MGFSRKVCVGDFWAIKFVQSREAISKDNKAIASSESHKIVRIGHKVSLIYVIS